MRLGARIREYREAAGLTQDALAEQLPGKSNGTQVSKWERGAHRPSDDTLEHIAKALHCTVADLYHQPSADKPSPDLMGALSAPDLRDQLDRIEDRLGSLEDVLRSLGALLGHDVALQPQGPLRRRLEDADPSQPRRRRTQNPPERDDERGSQGS